MFKSLVSLTIFMIQRSRLHFKDLQCFYLFFWQQQNLRKSKINCKYRVQQNIPPRKLHHTLTIIYPCYYISMVQTPECSVNVKIFDHVYHTWCWSKFWTISPWINILILNFVTLKRKKIFLANTGCSTKHDSWWTVLNVFFHINR